DLLDAERDATRVGVDLDNFRRDRFTLLEHLVRIVHAASPAHVADVHESVEAVFNFDKCAELDNVADFTGDDGADRIFSRREKPRIRLRLLHAEGNTAVARLDIQHNHVNFVADFHDFRGLNGLFRPTHFGSVNETFNTLFEFDESAVVHDADDFALE